MVRHHPLTAMRIKLVVILLLTLSACALPPSADPSVSNATTRKAQLSGEACVLIDTDFDIDDMMAIPVAMGSSPVKAIVSSEGYSLAPEGASALSRFVAEPGKQLPAIIVGASYPGTRDVNKWSWLPEFRASMQRINGLLSAPLKPAPRTSGSYTAEVTKVMAGCKSITVLIIGAFTSFTQYSPDLRERITLVVMQGRPFISDQYKNSKQSFNCEYDLNSCQQAFAQLKGLNAVWVDAPRDVIPPYSPSIEMVNGLDNFGLPGTLKAALMANPSLWNLATLAPGYQSRLWDQLAALYMLYPDVFHQVGDHMEPTLPPSEIQSLWTQAANKNNY